MKNEKYDELLELIKIFEKNKVTFPDNGQQNFHSLVAENNQPLSFQLLINRKGHLREDRLTYQMKSKEYDVMVRLDMTGPPHASKSGELISTPHVHIFDERHNYGKWAVALSEISNHKIIIELHDSLEAFLLYNNVNIDNLEIPIL